MIVQEMYPSDIKREDTFGHFDHLKSSSPYSGATGEATSRPFRFDSERVELSRLMFKDLLFDALHAMGANIVDLLEKGETGEAVYRLYEFMEKKVNES